MDTVNFIVNQTVTANGMIYTDGATIKNLPTEKAKDMEKRGLGKAISIDNEREQGNN